MQQIKVVCPNCGAEGTAGKYCEYCGTKIPMPKPKRDAASSDAYKKRILEFQTSEEDAVKKMLYELTENQNLPADFFQNCKVEEINPYYVPVYFFQCRFEAPWSCVKLVTKTYKVYNPSSKRNETETTTERYPMNGVAMGSCNFMGCACKDEDVPKELCNFIKQDINLHLGDDSTYYDYSTVRELTDAELAILVEDGGISQQLSWKQASLCESSLDTKVKSSVQSQLPDSYEDLSYSYSYNTQSKYMLMPFWVINYSYKGGKHNFVTDGLTKIAATNSPKDEQQALESESLADELDEATKKVRWRKICFLSFALIAFFLFLFVSWMSVFVNLAFVILAIITGIDLLVKIHAKQKAYVNLYEYLNDAWRQRKEQLLAVLPSNKFGMSVAKVRELQEVIESETRDDRYDPDSGRQAWWVYIVLILLVAAYGYRIINNTDSYKDTAVPANTEQEDYRSPSVNTMEETNSRAEDNKSDETETSEEFYASDSCYGEMDNVDDAWEQITLYGSMIDENGVNPIEISFEQNDDQLANCIYTNVELGGKIRMTGEINGRHMVFIGKDGRYEFRIVIDKQSFDGIATDGPKELTVSLDKKQE